ncbi:hypothetical protein AGLY_008272 [Aphis glycines]|uniref:Small ribosomal subunit protein eS7 n=1 Tax=Aphis glycines TaxID=307491 RepID=A0A6G0TNM5_APHGL|nr:hypothetical protein AGLY_008272 [Aphis glycines]
MPTTLQARPIGFGGRGVNTIRDTYTIPSPNCRLHSPFRVRNANRLWFFCTFFRLDQVLGPSSENHPLPRYVIMSFRSVPCALGRGSTFPGRPIARFDRMKNLNNNTPSCMPVPAQSKIVKKGNSEPDQFELSIAQALLELQNNSDLKAQLRELYITKAKEIELFGKKNKRKGRGAARP